MKRAVLVDFETQGTCDLKMAGAAVYAAHPHTKPICLSVVPLPYTWEQFTWVPPTPGVNPYAANYSAHEHLMNLAADPEMIFIAWNAPFEMAIWHHCMEPLGFPPISLSRWHDAAAVAAERGLP